MNHETAQSDWQTVASCLASQNYISIVKGLVHHFTAIDDNHRHMLPTMRSDVILTYGKQCLIIDTKYYTSMLQQYFDTRTIHSGNLYQIFAYVKNEALHLKPKQINVAGMLLYAKTDEQLAPDNTIQMIGNTISVKTLDLNQDFIHIAKQLDDIVYNYFKI